MHDFDFDLSAAQKAAQAAQRAQALKQKFLSRTSYNPSALSERAEAVKASALDRVNAHIQKVKKNLHAAYQ